MGILLSDEQSCKEETMLRGIIVATSCKRVGLKGPQRWRVSPCLQSSKGSWLWCTRSAFCSGACHRPPSATWSSTGSGWSARTWKSTFGNAMFRFKLPTSRWSFDIWIGLPLCYRNDTFCHSRCTEWFQPCKSKALLVDLLLSLRDQLRILLSRLLLLLLSRRLSSSSFPNRFHWLCGLLGLRSRLRLRSRLGSSLGLRSRLRLRSRLGSSLSFCRLGCRHLGRHVQRLWHR